MLKNILLILAFTFIPTIGQTGNAPRSDGFQGLVLNQTSSKEAFNILGKTADEDKIDKLDVSRLGKWLDAKHKEKIFRHLTFKKIGDFGKIKLSFLEDKLVVIELEFAKNFHPDKLPKLFAVKFAPVGGWADLPDTPGQYPRPFFVTTYPDSFNLVGISEQAFIWTNCQAITGVPNTVEKTRQISRVLEKK